MSRIWMLWAILSCLGLLQVILAETGGERTIHRLVGGHLHLVPYDADDDTELIITSSAGGGRDGKQQKVNEDGEEKKTLSQQVADGKYGLIQKELFSKPIKRPGVISYDSNSEVPKDNINNLGGLSKNDIWLAENHLLVLRGGSFPAHDDNSHPLWPPIDDYNAPNRQVKIPSHPKVPPPFPVQLTDNGPLQILGSNSTTTLNGTFAAAPYPLSPTGEGGFYPSYPSDGQYPSNFTPGESPFPIPPYPGQPGDYGPPFPPLNGSPPPYFANLPPGAAILPPPNNISEYDEDDPSIYYPPPYSFYYQMENTTLVPPGPLVPGIVLPPPPNFFAPLDKPRRKPQPPTVRPTQRPTTIKVQTEPYRKRIQLTTTPYPTTTTPYSTTPINRPFRIQPIDINHQLKPHTTYAPRVVTILPVRYHTTNRTFVPITTTIKPYIPERRKKPPPQTVTVLKPVKSTTQPPATVYFYENNEVAGRPYNSYGPPSRQRTVISSTQIPLKAYYTTSNEIDTNSVTQLPESQYYTRGGISSVQQPKTTKGPRQQYYFYEEEAVTNSITTARAPKQQKQSDPYFNIPKEYYLPAKQNVQRPQQYYYINNNNRPYSTNKPTSRYRFVEAAKKPSSDTFSVHVARLKQQIHQYYTTPSPYYETQRPQSSPKPVYQFSFQAANYQPQSNQFRASPIDGNDSDEDKFRPMNKYNVQIQPAVEINPTEPPVYQNTPASIYYQQQQHQQHQQQQQQHQQQQQLQQQKQVSTERPVPSKYYSTARPDYDYDDVDVDTRQNNNNNNRYVATPRPITQYSYEATQNPIYQPYYTKQEETYFDDITKKYFTIFGKKIPGVTTPLSNVEATTANPRRPQNVQIQYAQSIGKPVSLEGDTLVNYVQQRQRNNNQQSEYVPDNRPKYPQVAKYVPQQAQYLPAQGNLQGDINVNYKQPRPSANADAEIVQAIPVKISAEGKPGSFISYELPGDDGAHFYFLTPQLAQRRDQGAGYYYASPEAAARVRRREER